MERYIFLRRVFYFLEMCENRNSGTRKELAIKFGISESAVKRMISDIRDSGVGVKFDFALKSYIQCNSEDED